MPKSKDSLSGCAFRLESAAVRKFFPISGKSLPAPFFTGAARNVKQDRNL
jgi:hypothetical protein